MFNLINPSILGTPFSALPKGTEYIYVGNNMAVSLDGHCNKGGFAFAGHNQHLQYRSVDMRDLLYKSNRY